MQTNILGLVIVILVVVLFYCLFGRKKHEQYYFAAHEVVFEISHPTSTTPAEIVAAMESFLRPQRTALQEVRVSTNVTSSEGGHWRNKLQPPASDSRIITFPSQTDETFSLIPIRLTGHWNSDLRPNAVIRILIGAYAELQDGPLAIGKDINLQSISPNWFAKSLYHGGSTGGPASWPLDAITPQQLGVGTPSQRSEHEFRLAGSIDSLIALKHWAADDQVHVAILDTAPSGNNLEQAAQRFIAPAAIASPSASLIRYLFNSGLDIRPYSNPNELTNLLAYPPPQPYEVSDHGTFVAGIVHSIAPSATLHLYEVLNSFGLGTLTSMAQGLVDAVNNHYKAGETSLIINCSFMLDMVDLTQIVGLRLTNSNASALPTKSIFGVLKWITGLENVLVVAAAGNGAESGARYPACYPAAFKGVIGVGALPKGNPTYSSGRYIPASYSDLSYDPNNKLPGDGFMTFGGELDEPYLINEHNDPDDPNHRPISSRGVLGVFVGKSLHQNPSNLTTPTGTPLQLRPSSEGWARWAGTSFAAPIITGLLAAKPTELVHSSTTRAGPYLTAEGENVILVEQG